MSQRVTDGRTDGLSDGLQELLEWLFATNKVSVLTSYNYNVDTQVGLVDSALRILGIHYCDLRGEHCDVHLNTCTPWPSYLKEIHFYISLNFIHFILSFLYNC